MNIQLTDVNGNIVLVDSNEINKVISEDGATIFGMSLREITMLRMAYMKAGGKMPITKENVNEIEIKSDLGEYVDAALKSITK